MSLLLLRLLSAVSASALSNADFKPWTCDEITPDMCDDLTLMMGSVQVRNLSVQYYVYSPREGQKNGMLPLVTVHGGPAFTHNYLLPLKQQACRGRKVIFYDQAGCGESTRVANVSENAPWLLTIDYYIEELHAVVQHLGIDKFHLFGNSWGGLLVLKFAFSRYMDMIQGLVVSGGLSDGIQYAAMQREYLQKTMLPPALSKYMVKIQTEGKFDDPKYKALSARLSSMWTTRLYPYPQCFLDSREKQNEEIYTLVQGPDEFSVAGVLAQTNFTGELHKITAPTLMTHGRFDTMTLPQQQIIANQIPNLHRLITYEQSGHITFIDNAGEYNEDIAAFLSQHDQQPIVM